MKKIISSKQLYQVIPQLVISSSGIFKYILIKCKVNGIDLGTLIRGDKRFDLHPANFDNFLQELKTKQFTQLKKQHQIITATRNEDRFQFICPGGGRIQHNSDGRRCSIYGYSQHFGRVDHRQAQKIISSQLGYRMEDIVLNQKTY